MPLGYSIPARPQTRMVGITPARKRNSATPAASPIADA